MKKKRYLALFLSIALIGGGVWFTSTSAYKFLAGYLLFKSGAGQAEQEAASASVESPVQKDKKEASFLYERRPEKGEEIGTLTIPKIDASLPIVHGTDEDELEKGVGHFAGSVLPGENDNTVLSGHRDTVFRRLGEVGKNDILIVKTSAGEFTYKVRKVRIVDQDDRTVIVPKPKATLTVSTCYPFDFIGSAPERYILVADLVESS